MSRAYRKRKKSLSREERQSRRYANDAVSPAVVKQNKRQMKIQEYRMKKYAKLVGEEENVNALEEEVKEVVAEEATTETTAAPKKAVKKRKTTVKKTAAKKASTKE